MDITEINKLILNEDWSGAESRIVSAQRDYKSNPNLYIRLAQVYLAQSRIAEAEHQLVLAETVIDMGHGEPSHSDDINIYRAIIDLETHLREADPAEEDPFPYANRPEYAKWRNSISERQPQDYEVQHEPRFKIDRSTKIASAGSCFAQHIGRWLAENNYNYLTTERAPVKLSSKEAADQGYGVFSARYGNIYTPLQLVQLFDRAYGAFSPSELPWRSGDGFIDPFRPGIQKQPFPSIERMFFDLDSHFQAVRTLFEECDLFIFTLGLTEAWRSKKDGAVFPICPGRGKGVYSSDHYEFINFTVEDVTNHLEEFIERLRGVNIEARILLTVSPVPLVATMEDRPALQSTVYSKSVLRAAVSTLRERHNHVEYLASYEMITHSFQTKRFLKNDLRSVTDNGVRWVMETFQKKFCREEQTEDTEARNAPLPIKPEQALLQEDVAGFSSILQPPEIICDEEIAYDFFQQGDNFLTEENWEFYSGNDIYIYCPQQLWGAGKIPEPYAHFDEDFSLIPFNNLPEWVSALRESGGDTGVTACFGGSHSKFPGNWPSHLHSLAEEKSANIGVVASFAVNGARSIHGVKLLQHIVKTLSEEGIKIDNACQLYGANDVLHTYTEIYYFLKGHGKKVLHTEEEFFLPFGISFNPFEIPDGLASSAFIKPPQDCRGTQVSFPLLRPSASWEMNALQRILAAVEAFKRTADTLDIVCVSALQPISSASLFPSYSKTVQDMYRDDRRRDKNETFLEWRIRNKICIDPGELHAIHQDGIDCSFDFEYLYFALIDHIGRKNKEEVEGFIDLSRCFSSNDPPDVPTPPFTWDAYHYTNDGSNIIARNILEALLG